jgi:radical SAM superfamily enzyme YgiQ (UPF0313 family)
MKKIVLIAVNARFSHPNPALHYLRNALDGLGYDIRIKEFTIRADPGEIARFVTDENPVAAAFSVYIWNTVIVRGVLRRLGEADTHCAVVLGGPEVSYNPGEWLAAYPAADYIVTGHGEAGFRRLALEGFSGAEPIIPPMNPHFAEIPFPYTDDDLEGFAHRNVYYESSRGCPFRCAYCLSSRGDQKLEFRGAAQVAEEVARIMRHRPRLVKFVDRTFNADAGRAREIWPMLMERYAEWGTVFHFEVHPALLVDEDLALLENAPPGLFQFEMGIQSTHADALRAAGRKGDWAREEAAITRIISGAKIRAHLDLIAGLPFEGLDGIAESFNRVYHLGADHFQLGTLKLLPGTEMRERAAEFGMRFDPEPPYEISENRWLTRGDMALVKRIARLLDGLYNSGKFRTTLSELLPRFETPWAFYAALAGRFADTSDISWLRMHGLVEGLALALCPGDAGLVRDCLSWDWFSGFNTHRVPSFIKTGAMRDAKRRMEDLVRSNPGRNTGITIDGIGRARVFAPATREFSGKYMEGKGVAVFVEGGAGPLLLPG